MLRRKTTQRYAAALLLAFTLLLQGARWLPHTPALSGTHAIPMELCPGESDGDVCE